MSEHTPSRLNTRPAFLPYFRFAWIIPATVAGVFATAMSFGVNVPVPFASMLVVIVIGALMSHALSGLLSGLSLTALGTYIYVAQIGTPPRLESVNDLLVLSLVGIGLGFFLGKLRASLEAALGELRNQSDRVATENARLSTQVNEHSEALNTFRQQLSASQNRLRNATRRLIDAQESERRGLAKELHDDIGQSLTALRINLESNKRNFSQDETSLKFIETSYSLVDEIIASVRELSLTLRPSLLDDLGLVAALRDYITRQLGRADITFDFKVSGKDDGVEPTQSIAAYRIVQEIITNIIKHAFAGTCRHRYIR